MPCHHLTYSTSQGRQYLVMQLLQLSRELQRKVGNEKEWLDLLLQFSFHFILFFCFVLVFFFFAKVGIDSLAENFYPAFTL